MATRSTARARLLAPPFLPWRQKGCVLGLVAGLSPMTLSVAEITGTGTITSVGTAITGSGTAFTGEVVVGDVIAATDIAGTVTAIASATAMTLDTENTQAVGQAFTATPVAGVSERVTQWNDLSGNGNHASQATQINKPSLLRTGLGGRPALSFDGVDDGMTTALALTVP